MGGERCWLMALKGGFVDKFKEICKHLTSPSPFLVTPLIFATSIKPVHEHSIIKKQPSIKIIDRKISKSSQKPLKSNSSKNTSTCIIILHDDDKNLINNLFYIFFFPLSLLLQRWWTTAMDYEFFNKYFLDFVYRVYKFL